MIITVDTTSISIKRTVKALYPESLKNLDYIDTVHVRNWHDTEALYIVKNNDATIGDGIYIPNGMGEVITRTEFDQYNIIATGTNDKVDIVLKDKNNFNINK